MFAPMACGTCNDRYIKTEEIIFKLFCLKLKSQQV